MDLYLKDHHCLKTKQNWAQESWTRCVTTCFFFWGFSEFRTGWIVCAPQHCFVSEDSIAIIKVLFSADSYYVMPYYIWSVREQFSKNSRRQKHQGAVGGKLWPRARVHGPGAESGSTVDRCLGARPSCSLLQEVQREESCKGRQSCWLVK